MAVPFFDITRQNQSVRKELDAAIREVVDSGRFILGQKVADLEKEVAGLCGVKHAVGVASGTDALHLALRACGVKEGDEVITTPFTFVATVEAIAYCGAKPVFVDIEPKTFNIDPDKIEPAITGKTKAVLPVHLYGQTCDIQKMAKICQKHGIKLIEDCAQSIGSEFDSQKTGSFGDAGCFSFFPTKNLGCFGDGGVVTTNQDQVAEELRVLRGHGSRTTYHYDLVGYNSRLDALQAAIIMVKLPLLARLSQARKAHAAFYNENLRPLGQVVLPAELPKADHVYNQYTIRAKDRDKLQAYLKEKGIGAMVYYPLSLHLQKAFAGLGYQAGDFPESEAAQREVLSLPIFPELAQTELAETCAAIKDYYGK